MLKRLFCFFWGHKFKKRIIIEVHASYDVTQDYYLPACDRCNALNPNYNEIKERLKEFSFSFEEVKGILRNIFEKNHKLKEDTLYLFANILHTHRVFSGEAYDANMRKAKKVLNAFLEVKE